MVLYTENLAHIWSTTTTSDLMLTSCILRHSNPSQTAAVMVLENSEIGQTMALWATGPCQQSSLFPSPPPPPLPPPNKKD